jgi:hypothetical protein
MAVGIVDGVILQISRVMESLFDGIEYRKAKNASIRMEKERMKARRRLCESRANYLNRPAAPSAAPFIDLTLPRANRSSSFST